MAFQQMDIEALELARQCGFKHTLRADLLQVAPVCHFIIDTSIQGDNLPRVLRGMLDACSRQFGASDMTMWIDVQCEQFPSYVREGIKESALFGWHIVVTWKDLCSHDKVKQLPLDIQKTVLKSSSGGVWHPFRGIVVNKPDLVVSNEADAESK